jgi:hypothetical protein
MRIGGSKTPQEALLKATGRISNLRSSLPGKVGTILTCLDEIRNDWEGNPKLLQQFPLNQLYEQIVALDAAVRSEYDDLEQTVDRRASVYEEILSLYHRFHLSSEFFASSKVLESVERYLERIDTMLPVRNYSVRDLLSELNAHRINPVIKKRLDVALHKFDQQEYQAVLQECGQAGEALFALYKNNLVQCGCNRIPGNMGLALDHIRRWLSENGTEDRQGYSFAPHARIEWFLLSLFESLHYLRNAVSHPNRGGGTPPRMATPTSRVLY